MTYWSSTVPVTYVCAPLSVFVYSLARFIMNRSISECARSKRLLNPCPLFGAFDFTWWAACDDGLSRRFGMNIYGLLAFVVRNFKTRYSVFVQRCYTASQVSTTDGNVAQRVSWGWLRKCTLYDMGFVPAFVATREQWEKLSYPPSSSDIQRYLADFTPIGVGSAF